VEATVWAILKKDGDEVHAIFLEPVGLEQVTTDHPGATAVRTLKT
jgi:hypothetical protein